MRRYILSFVVLALLMGCGGGGGGGGSDEVPVSRQWLVLVYMAGDNNLDSYVDRDLGEMDEVAFTDAVKVVALVDKSTEGEDGVWESTPDGMKQLETYSYDVDTASAGTLENFLKKYIAKYPAPRVALIIWDHGSGWLIDRSGKSAAVDDKYGFLNIYELRNALESVNRTFDLIGFDECYMGNLAVIYAVKDWAKNIVVSEPEEPGDGWDYSTVFRKLVDNPYVDGTAFGKIIVDAYKNNYASENRALALITREQADRLLDSVDSFCDYVLSNGTIDGLTLRNDATLNALGAYYDNPYMADMFVDLKAFVQDCKEKDTNCTACDDVVSVIDQLYVAVTGTAKVSGIAAYFPDNSSFDDRYYNATLNPYAVRKWDDCLEKFYGY